MQVHCPGFVRTKMFVQPRDIFQATPEEFTRQAVRCIGRERLAMPCASHAFARYPTNIRLNLTAVAPFSTPTWRRIHRIQHA